MKQDHIKWHAMCLRSLTCAFFLLATQAQAQYATYRGGFDHTYSSVATIDKSAPNLQGQDGYAIATTNVDAGMVVTFGEIIRTDATGSQLWTMEYPTGVRSRFTSIETYNFSGTTNYLVVGSIDNAGSDNLLVACVDDNGTVIRSTKIPPSMRQNLIGLKGIPTSDGGFAITGVESQVYNVTGDNTVVVLKLDSLLNVLYYHVYETQRAAHDYDVATNIVEGATADEFLIVGSANKDYSGTFNVPCAMSALIDMPTGNVVWSHNYSTADNIHWDAASDAWYDPTDNSFWILGNSSVRHYFNITHLDNTGSSLTFQQYNGAGFTYYDVYGFELRPSLQTPGNFVVGCWKYPSGGMSTAVNPVLVEIDPSTYTVPWSMMYTGSSGSLLADNNRMSVFNENYLLMPRGSSQFPFFYNTLMAYKSDGNGYAILSSDSVGSTIESPQFWYTNNTVGEVRCGSNDPDTEPDPWSSYDDSPLQYMMSFTPTGSYSLSYNTTMHNEEKCSNGQRKGNATTIKQQTPGTFRLYPNPASDYFTVESVAELRTIILTDIYGREVSKIDITGTNKHTISTTDLTPGVYMVRLVDKDRAMMTQTIQILK